jgi:hypothetical protein
MVVGVGPFKAIIPNQYGAGQYLVQSDAVVNLTFADGEAAVARIDRIIARVYNTALDSSGQSDAFVEYLKGQASGAATSVPNGALLLWEVSVPAGTSAGGGGINFTSVAVDKRVYTTASGGIIPVASTVEMTAITNQYEGMTVHVKDVDHIYTHDGTSFKLRGQASVASASNLSSISNPWDGLIVSARDTNILYQYSGSAWVPCAGNVKFVSKPIGTAKASNTTFSADPHLTLAMEANATYVIKLVGFLTGSATAGGDYKWRFTFPAGATVSAGQIGMGQGNTSDVATSTADFAAGYGQTTSPTASTQWLGAIAAAPTMHIVEGLAITGGTAGSLTLEWAQVTSNGVGTTLLPGSYLRLERVA